jgi:hypothetical protein
MRNRLISIYKKNCKTLKFGIIDRVIGIYYEKYGQGLKNTCGSVTITLGVLV